jgi:predicted RecA/RadA family phage recombinase
MKNAYQDGRVIDVTLAAAVASGGVVTKGRRLLGVAVMAGRSGDVVPCHVEGVFSLPKLNTAVIAEGDAVTWSDGLGRVIVASAAVGDIEHFGYAVAAAGNGTTEVLVRLCPGVGVRKAT